MTEQEQYAYRGYWGELARTLWYRTPLVRDVYIALRKMLDFPTHLWNYQTKVHLLETRVKVYRLQESGIQVPERPTPRLIVSLTSHPARIAQSYAAVYTLLTQSLKPDKVVMWLAESQFPCKEHDLPYELLHLRQFGLSIQWCEDLKSLKKIIPSIKACPDDIIVVADDDILYPVDWLKILYTHYQKDPSCIHGNRSFLCFWNNACDADLGTNVAESGVPSLLCVPSAGMGVLYPPHSLHEDVVRSDMAMEVAPREDQGWCWVMAVRKRTRIHIADDEVDLKMLCLAGSIAGRKIGFSAYPDLMKTYPDVLEILKEEWRAVSTAPCPPFQILDF
ncbi:MAG: hypothetical protein LBJ70_03295 [Holosporales bacterium]|nr:hypothetical protein [Holosporales bacterium]